MNIVKRINRIIHEIRNVSPASLPDLSTTWQDKNIPLKQACVADKELIDTRNGKPPEIFVAAANLLKIIPQDREYSFLDIACGYGYYSEVISLLVPNLMIQYTGTLLSKII